MGVNEIREKFLKYYSEQVTSKHVQIPSYPILPENDPTTLFISSGMQPMIQYFLGEKHPTGSDKIVNSQKCFRAVDIDEVGDNRHTTFFEMLGNWSFGDYWKKEQLNFIFNFLVDELGLDPKKLFVTVFAGDKEAGIPQDDESVEIWKEIFSQRGISAEIGERIFFYDAKKNWWSRQGTPEQMAIGEPGGPDSEIFYEFDVEHDKDFGEECHPNCDCGKYVEIANSVFMEYKKVSEKEFEPLPKKNVDFGGGLERIAAAVLGNQDMFAIDVFANALEKFDARQGTSATGITKEKRIILDHLRAALFLIDSGVLPSNKGSGYVLRRLLRRSATMIRQKFGRSDAVEALALFEEITNSYIEFYTGIYFPNQAETKEKVKSIISEEITKFYKTLDKGLELLEKTEKEKIDAKFVFDLYQTHGFPLELTQEILLEKGVKVSEADFEKEKETHQDLSRTASAGTFKGGLGNTDEKSVWYHTLTHLLHQALRDVLGDHVHQAGSNITPDRLRFDFSHTAPMTKEEIEKVEKIVNEQKDRNLEVKMQQMSVEDAEKTGALAFFKEKYGEKVNVYSIGDFSKEICGGPHVSNTSEIKGLFKIQKEESVGSGVRRLKASVIL